MIKERSYGALQRIISGIVAVIMVFMLVPIVSAVSPEAIGNRIADNSTMDSWKQWFGSEVTHTNYAGGVWTDKSVFTDASAFPKGTVELDDENNFLVALSALAANKTIVGYTHLPTDTVFILDVSGSMEGRAEALVKATNASIKELMSLNNYNRIGVVLYSDGITTLLPLDRYETTDANGNFLSYKYENKKEYVGIAEYYDRATRRYISCVTNSKGEKVSGRRQVVEGTFIQGGIYGALQQFEAVSDVTIQDGFQAGTKRIPIFVLMSDGAPTYGTSNYTKPTRYDVGTGAHTNEGMAFLTQLTAAYARERVEEKYGKKPLFYSLGLIDGIKSDDLDDAKSVLDPVGNARELWNGYFRLTNRGTLAVTVPAYGRDYKLIDSTTSVSRNSALDTESTDYADGTFYASNAEGLIEKFQAVVDEIILQSRYYPTHLQGGAPDFSGYITFEDYIGEYMEIKDIKGILLGDILFDGAMLTSKLNSSSDGLGTIDDPTELGHEFIGSIKARFGIADTKDAQELVALAAHYGQVYYNSDEDFSNYIGWYAKADGSYHSFWHEGMTEHPADAVYINRSYGFLGRATGNIKDSDMMYMSVQVHTNIKSGHQAVIWKIPASLVPMVTYSVSLEGNSIDTATDIELEIIDASPIRLVFETGIRSDINELNVNSIMAAADSKFKTANGYRFWTNRWEDNGNVFNDIGTKVTFAPSVENERYYFNEDCDIYVSDGKGGYKAVSYNNASDFNSSAEYYRRRAVFALTEKANDGNAAEMYIQYEPITDEVLREKKQRDDGTWYIPMGTVSHLVDNYAINKSENITGTLGYSNNPYVQQTISSYEEHSLLGNNGRLELTPAQGIAISKTLEAAEPDASKDFDFIVKLKPNGSVLADSYSYILANIGEYEGTEGVVDVVNGEMKVTVPAGKTLYIIDIDENTEYSVSEVAHDAYQVKAVSVNGRASENGLAEGTVSKYFIDSIDFTNAPIVKGNLIITKTVTHPFGSGYTVPSGLEFDISVTLDGINVANQTYEAVTSKGAITVTADENGRIDFKLAHGEGISISGIPEGTKYSVTETDIEAGFSVSDNSKNLSGTIVADENITASLVNNYVPEPVTPNVEVTVIKELLGREFKEGDKFEFLLERYDGREGSHHDEVDRVTVSAMRDVKNGKLVAVMDLSAERLTEAGYYSYVISEVNDKELGNGIPGMSYDTTFRHFSITVADDDMDGKLEISDVEAVAPVSASKVNGGWTVNATFVNSYAPTVGADVNINISKEISAPSGATIGKNGFCFSLYDENGNKVVTSGLTDVNGKANISLSFPVTAVGTTVKYFLLEDIHETPVSGMTYSTEEYALVIEFVDNLDGTVGTLINGEKTDNAEFSFTNIYDPTDASLILSGTKLLNGRILNENEFSFSIYETDASFSIDGIAPLETVWAKYDGSFSFSLLNYGTVGRKYYVIAENNNGLGGITYDATRYNVTVDITADGAALSAKCNITANGVSVDGISFVNEYKVSPVSVTLKGEKVLSGRDIKDGEFEFNLIDSDGKVISTAKNVKSFFTFDKIDYVKAGVYEYTVVEKDTGLGGISYDKSVFRVTVTVADDGHGKLHTSVAYKKGNAAATSIVFVNTYTAAPAYAEFEGRKTLSGRPLVANEFEFVLTNTGNGRIIETVYNDANGNFKFSPREYRAADTYHYTVTEKHNGIGGVTYDTTVYSITVKVVDDGDGRLVASVEYHKGQIIVDGIVFNNSYHATATEITLSGKKLLSGREMNEKEFSFTLNGNGVSETVTNKADGVFEFNALTFDKAGVYNYTVNEVKGDLGGITYDETVYNVTVTVTDDLKGHLVASVSIDGKGELVFNNSYVASGTTAVISGNKTLSGREMNADEFEFVLKNENGDVLETVKNASSGAFAFTALEFNKAGVYNYTVNEVQGGLGGISYDGRIYNVTVTVTDDLKGNLVSTVEYTLGGEKVNALSFENRYSANSVDYAISGNKVQGGRELGEEFSFELYGPDQKLIESVRNKLGGEISFSAITYTEAGVYTYTVNEVIGTLGGITYDESVYTVTVTVEDGKNGELKIASVEYTVGGEAASAIVFTNEYNAKETTVTIGGNKLLNGREMNEKEFSFILDGNGISETVTNNANGTFAFNALTFDKVGVYTYTVKEVKGTLGGITYDESVYNVTVTVTDDLKGNLVAVVTYEKAGNSVEKIEFVNSYAAKETSYTFGGLKTVIGRPLNADEFEFELYNVGTDASIERVKNNAEGIFEFAPVTFDKAGVYSFKITEIDGDLGGITYDTAIYRINVTVEDDKNGALMVTSLEYIRNDQVSQGVTFENSYSAKSVSVEFNGNKQLDGRELEDGEFKFNLYETGSDFATDGLTPVTVTNKADGSFVFPIIEYNSVGTKYYVITETDGGLASITYDTAVYRITVSVSDNLNGALLADVSMQKADGSNAETVVFVNKYSELSTDVVLNVSKTVESKAETAIGANGFEFVLTRDGIEIGRAVTDQNGKAQFMLTFKEADVNKVYTYVMTEVNGGLPGITYDKTEYTFEIAVKYDETGKGLTATVTKNGESENAYTADFVNIYSTVEPGDTSTLLPWVLMLLVSGGAVITFATHLNKKREQF